MLRRWLSVGIGISLVVFAFLASIQTIHKVRAEDCDLGCLDRKIQEYRVKLDELSGQKKTLSASIDLIQTKILLAQNEIQKTETQIALLQQQIGELGVHISSLELSLNKLSTQLVQRIRSSYKESYRKSPANLLFASDFSTTITRQKYENLSQEYMRSIIQAAESQRMSFLNDRTLKEQKQKEVEKLQATLARQKETLAVQRAQKNNLLTVTKNDEKVYQSLLDQAEAQKKAFNRFVSSQGGASLLSNQTKCDDWGCYYNQRDTSWGTKSMGNSGEPMNLYGCLVSSMAMIATHYGKKLTPGDIASSAAPFSVNTAYMVQGSWTVNGVTATRTRVSFSTSRLDEELNAGRPVVIGLYSGPDHFIVIKGKNEKGYIMNDPWLENGGNRPFSDKYSISNISVMDLVRIN